MSDPEPLARIHIGQVDEAPIDLDDPQTADDGEPDDDNDEDREASPFLIDMLGFDPADLAKLEARDAEGRWVAGAGGGGEAEAKPKPTKASKKLTAEFLPGTSKEFQAKITSTLEAMPKGANAAVAKSGVTAKGAKILTDSAPYLKGRHPRGWEPGSTWEMVSGVYSMDNKAIHVSETFLSRNTGEMLTAPNRDHVMAHEFGHALDHALYNPSFNSLGFKTAYKEDVEAFKARGGSTSKMSYVLQPGTAGPQEMFAEQWAEKTHPSPRDLNLRVHFPACARYIDGLYDRCKTGIPKT